MIENRKIEQCVPKTNRAIRPWENAERIRDFPKDAAVLA